MCKTGLTGWGIARSKWGRQAQEVHLMNDRVMVVDDTPELVGFVADLLKGEGFEVDTATSLADLRQALDQTPPDVLLLDWKLPDGDGIDAMPLVRSRWPETPIIILTGYGNFDAAVEATKRGAFHFLGKPFRIEVLVSLVRRACEYKHLHESTNSLHQAVSILSEGASPVFRSPAMKTVLALVRRAAPLDCPVLVTGGPGTGKEVIANLIHYLSPRAKRRLVKVECNALPLEDAAAALFGHAQGTVASMACGWDGLLDQGEGGTVLLDEVTALPLKLQTQLAKAVNDRQYSPLGAAAPRAMDCRLIATSNLPIEASLVQDLFHENLFDCFSSAILHLPPLRERRLDIIPLASTFLRRFAAQAERSVLGFTNGAQQALECYDWPGNVRQLENEIQSAVLLAEGELVDLRHLPFSIRSGGVRRPQK